jgi:hypothetical protein
LLEGAVGIEVIKRMKSMLTNDKYKMFFNEMADELNRLKMIHYANKVPLQQN